ncbi:MAG: hypothetical protein ABI268_08565, partial [Rhodanobacter sp.]
MNPLLLHVIHGALCGGCYAVSPLVDTVVKDGFGASLHGGGLWDRSTRSTPEQCHDIPPHDQRLTTLSGMSFGAAYQQKLLNDPQLTFWSRPTITAMLAAGTLRSGADLAMLHAIQVAHDMHGHGVVDTVVLVDLAWDPGLLKHAFRGAFHASRV